MRYRQPKRILTEIAADSKTRAKTALEVAELLETSLPKLGPYPRKSAEGIRHRVASSQAHPAQRLKALCSLLLAAKTKLKGKN
jgi:hypothetical protein